MKTPSSIAILLGISTVAPLSAATIDDSLIAFLQGLGHTVSEQGEFTTGPAFTTTPDLVIVSRDTNSGNYDETGEPEDWNGLSTPMILMNPFLVRENRWGWVSGSTNYDSVLSDAGNVETTLVIGSDPWVTGLSGDFYPDTFANSDALTVDLAGGAGIGTTIATITGDEQVGTPDNDVTGITLMRIASGTVTNNSRGTMGAARGYFAMWEYPDGADGSTTAPNEDAEAWALTAEGEEVLTRMITELGGASSGLNIALVTQGTTLIPEPGAPLLFSLTALAGIVRRRRR